MDALYDIVLLVHSWLRWVVLLSGLGLIAFAARALAGGHPFAGAARAASIVFLASFHTQILLGLALWAALSPTTKAAFSDFGAAMKSAPLRFWAVEHLALMIAAAIVAQLGVTSAKRAADDPRRAARRLLIGTAIALALVAAAIPWAFRTEIARPLFRL